MRLGLSTALAVLMLGLPLGAARAGGVVIDFRETGWSAAEDSTSTEAAGENFPIGAPATPPPATKRPQAGSTPTTSPEPQAPASAPAPELQEHTQVLSTKDVQDLEVQLLLQNGLITAEEATSGCGGSSSAQGPLGLLPLLIASLPLLSRRRK